MKEPSRQVDGIAEPPKLPNLIRRDGNVFYFKKKAPADLARLFGRKAEFWKSLGTTDIAVANACREAANDEYLSWCNELRRSLGVEQVTTAIGQANQGTKYFQAHMIPQLLSRHRFHMLQTSDELRYGESLVSLREETNFNEMYLTELRNAAAGMNTSIVADTARQLLEGENLIPIVGSEAWKAFLPQLLEAEIEVLQETIARFSGLSCKSNGELPTAVRSLATVSDAFEQWRIQYRAKVGASNDVELANDKTEDTYERYAARFISICGDLPLKAIELADVQRFVEGLALEGLVRGTVKNHVSALAVMLRSALPPERDNEGRVIHKSVFDYADLRSVTKTPDSQLRRRFEEYELEMLLNSSLYRAGRDWGPELDVDHAHYWLIPFSMYVAPRIEEYAQLLVKNVMKRNGTWGVLLSDVSAGLKRKSISSTRFIPLHKELIDWGFIRYVEHMHKQGHTRLFPTLENNNRYKRYGDGLSKWFAGYCDSVGLSDSTICHHSFRYTLSQKLLSQGAQEVAVDAILGHWLTKQSLHSTRGYLKQSGALPQEILENAIGRLDFFGPTGISMVSQPPAASKSQLKFSMPARTFSVSTGQEGSVQYQVPQWR